MGRRHLKEGLYGFRRRIAFSYTRPAGVIREPHNNRLYGAIAILKIAGWNT